MRNTEKTQIYTFIVRHPLVLQHLSSDNFSSNKTSANTFLIQSITTIFLLSTENSSTCYGKCNLLALVSNFVVKRRILIILHLEFANRSCKNKIEATKIMLEFTLKSVVLQCCRMLKIK